MTDLDINCLPLRALRSASANVGRTSRDKFSELNKHIPPDTGSSGFIMNPCQCVAHRNLVARGTTPASMFTVKVWLFTSGKEVLEQWGGVQSEGLGPPKRLRDKSEVR